MDLDTVLMIPFLSKELNLVGYAKLPYKLCRMKKKKQTQAPQDKASEGDGSDFSSDDETAESSSFKVIFDNGQMIASLVTVCFELVKQIKNSHHFNETFTTDRLIFDNRKLETQLKSCKQELKEKINQLSICDEKQRQLKGKLEELKMKVKHLEREKRKIIEQNQTAENQLHHELRRKSNQLKQLHKVIQKRFDMVDLNYVPENFVILQQEQPDFSKLWSQVKYSSSTTKANALMNGLCKFQQNNRTLMEDNIALKTLLFSTWDVINEITLLTADKMKVNMTRISKKQISRILMNVQTSHVSSYRTFLRHQFLVLQSLLSCLDNCSFVIGNDVFVCWSDAVKQASAVQQSHKLSQCFSFPSYENDSSGTSETADE